ncbi:MAG: 2-aminoethylphosphonate--pyruvate transaminase [Myxococcales bacterium]|nr:2-aminoethylphosphonate--pyruvate transaminase [Myxococcales bacterium]
MTSPMILLNPGPANTTETVKRAMTRPDICPREREFGDVLMRVRDGLTRVVHEGDRYTAVLFCGSGTAGVEAAVASTVPHDGRLLVIENGPYGERIVQIAAAYNMPHDVERFGVGGYPDVDRIEQRLATGRFTHAAVVHHETSTGMLNPVERIAAACRAQGVKVIVDAMSSYAGLAIDVEQLGAQYLVSSSNKCIQGMAGLSFVICERASLEALKPLPGRGLYLNLSEQHRFLERTGQMQFTPPVQVVYALSQALDEYFAEGAAERAARYRANWDALDSGMLRLGFRRLLPEAILSRILTAYLEPDHEHYDFDRMHDDLYRRGFTIYPGKGARKATFRLANMGAVTPADMHAFVAALEDTLTAMGVNPLYTTPAPGSEAR